MRLQAAPQTADPDISWGVDGYGVRHYLCDTCGERLGTGDAARYFDLVENHTCAAHQQTNRKGIDHEQRRQNI